MKRTIIFAIFLLSAPSAFADIIGYSCMVLNRSNMDPVSELKSEVFAENEDMARIYAMNQVVSKPESNFRASRRSGYLINNSDDSHRLYFTRCTMLPE